MNCPKCKANNAEDARFCGTCGHTLATTESSNPKIAIPTTEAPSLIGREIAGRYRIQAKLGEGGMGAVYKAEQISLKRTVAVKLLRPEVANSQMLLRRFNAEAELVAKLSHPNTVGIYDFGQDSDGTLFIAMEYIVGKSLRDVIHQEAPLTLRRSLAIAAQVGASLVDAHAHGIVHRDLKPDNVMLQERGRQRDVVRVLDFGIAKLRDENRQSQLAMTQAGDMLGTPQYMAPEQIRGEAIDGRTDIYSLGGLMYEMVTGRLPFEAPTVMALLSKHLLETIVPPSQRRPDLALPPAIDMLILNAMAKDPAARPATMEQFADEIGALLATFPPETGQSTAQSTAQGTAQRPAMTAGQNVATPPAWTNIAGPPPGVFAPPSPPPGAPAMPPPMGAAPTMPAAGFGPPAAPYNPHANAQPAPMPAPKRSGGMGIWVLIGLLAVAGAGVGVYFGVIRKDEKGSTNPTPGSGSEVAETPAGKPDAAEGAPPPQTPDAAPQQVGSADNPWAKGGGTTIPKKGSADDTGDDEPGGDDDDAPTPPTRPRTPAGSTGLPPECEAYARSIEALSNCPAFPAQSRDAMLQAAEQMRKTYGSMPPAARKQVAAACSQAVQALKQVTSAYNCNP